MAKVNRFYRSPERQLIDPITLQEALVIPTMMRQKHNAMAQAAAQNSVLDADTLDMDEEAARKLLDPIEAGANKIAEDLNKYGFSQERVNELINLQTEKQRVERDSIGKLTSRKQQFQAAQQAINEKFKDDEDSRNSSLNRLGLMNKTPASFEDDKLNVPGIKSPEYYERLTTEDKTKLFKELSSILEPTAKETGYQVDTIQGLAAFQQAVSNGKVEGVTPEEYQQLFTSVMGSEVLNDFKQEAFNKGLGINEEVDQKYKKDTIQEVSDQLEKAVEKGKMSEQQASDQLENLKQASAEDVYAQVERSKMITGVASAAGYTQNSIDTKFLNNSSGLKGKDATNILNNTIPNEILFGSQGMKSNFSELTDGINDLQYDKKGNLIGVKPKESYLTTDQVTKKQYYYRNKETGKIVDRSSAVHPKSGLLDKYERVQASSENLSKRVENFKPLQELKKNIPNSSKYSDKELLEGYTGAVNNSDAQVLKSFEYFNNNGKDALASANEKMLGLDDNGNITRVGTAESRSNFITDNGKPKDFKEVMEELGFEISNETSYTDFAKVVKPRITGYLSQLGRYSVSVRTEDGNGKTILMQPDNTLLQKSSKPSTLLYNFSKSGKVYEVLDGKENRPYLPSDEEDKIMVAYNNMGNIFSKGSSPRIGYVEIDKKDLKNISGTNIEHLIDKGTANYIPQEEVDFESLQASVSLIVRE